MLTINELELLISKQKKEVDRLHNTKHPNELHNAKMVLQNLMDLRALNAYGYQHDNSASS